MGVETFSNRPNGDKARWLADLKQIYIDTVSRVIVRRGVESLLKWLEGTDFYTSEASAKYHSNFEGGLLFHTLAVHETLKTLVKVFGYQDRISPETIAIVSLFHDLCKVNTYQTEMRNRKNEETKKWEQYPFRKVVDKVPMGHGEKSVFIVQNFMRLSLEEALAIRWHMMWSYDQPSNPSINPALNTTPLVLLTANADHLASIVYEYEEQKGYDTQPLQIETFTPSFKG